MIETIYANSRHTVWAEYNPRTGLITVKSRPRGMEFDVRHSEFKPTPEGEHLACQLVDTIAEQYKFRLMPHHLLFAAGFGVVLLVAYNAFFV